MWPEKKKRKRLQNLCDVVFKNSSDKKQIEWKEGDDSKERKWEVTVSLGKRSYQWVLASITNIYRYILLLTLYTLQETA